LNKILKENLVMDTWMAFYLPTSSYYTINKKKDMQPTVKYGLIAFIWIFVFAIGFRENNNKTYSKLPDIIETTTTTQEKEQKKK
ncbi:hypothetical protein ODV97_17880, partial [Enterococcus gallinarum]|nr:hypothetical protein [Enterococcus gallinarum]